MHHMEKSIAELHGMLKNVKTNIQKTNLVLMVQKGEGMKRKGKGKGNKAKKGKGQSKPKAKKPKPPKEGVCFFCNEQGHWKRNCKLYLEDLKKKEEYQGYHFRYLCYRSQSVYLCFMGIRYWMWISHLCKCVGPAKQ